MERSPEVLVLVSFCLQLFLFFIGGLRRRTRSYLLRFTLWVAYVGADLVAIYALGILSRDANAMESGMALLWAPFLIIHLGGQDTITAFSMEDNFLWKRHLLNLLVQVTLALYVFFWKPSSSSSTQVLFPGVLLFAAGIIKYGERTAALKQAGDLGSMVAEANDDGSREQKAGDLVKTICADALRSAPGIRMLFAGHTTAEVAADLMKTVDSYPSSFDRHTNLFMLMDVELAMVYGDLYTKAAVLRTRTGIVFRCISLACTVAALVLFFSYTTSSSSSTAAVITYTLFIGGIAVDVCSLLAVYMASPWAWACCLRARSHRRTARVSRCLLSCWDIIVSGCLGMASRPLWSNTMGQYRFVYYDDDSRSWAPQPPTLSEGVMCVVRKLAGVGGDKGGPFCLNRLLETKQVVVDDNVALCLVKEIDDIATAARQPRDEQKQQQWRCLGQLLLEATQRRQELTNDFVRLVSWLHACTETLLCQAAEAAAANKAISIATGTAGAAASADVCRKLSRYMMYLVAAANPAGGGSLLQVVSGGNPEAEFRRWDGYRSYRKVEEQQDDCSCAIIKRQQDACKRLLCGDGSPAAATLWPCSEMWQETLEELKHMWARLLVYAASRSRPEAHAAALARGGELLTFVWLLLSHHGLGASSTGFQVEVDLVKGGPKHGHSSKRERRYYVFNNLPVQMVNSPQLHSKLTSTPTGSESHYLADSTVDP